MGWIRELPHGLIESTQSILSEDRTKYDSTYIISQLDMLIGDTDDQDEIKMLTALRDKIFQSYPNNVTIYDIEHDIRNEPSMRYLWDTELWKYVKDQLFTESVISERAIKDKYDRVYTDLLKQVKRLKWDSPPQKYKTSAAHSIEGTIDGKRFAFEFHKPDSKWGPGWAFLGLHTEATFLFSNDSLNFSLQKNKSDKDQQENIRAFEDAIKYITSGQYKR